MWLKPPQNVPGDGREVILSPAGLRSMAGLGKVAELPCS